MKKYILRRLLISLFTIWTITTTCFFLVHLLPGNPVAVNSGRIMAPETMERMMHYYGLDRPIYEQYFIYMKNLLHGDFGYSLQFPGQSVNNIIAKKFPVSCQLGLQAYIFSFPVGIAFGIISARTRGKWSDYCLVALSAIVVSMPVFIIATILQLVFAVKLKIFPVALWQNFACTILPTLTLSFSLVASKSRAMRTLMLEILNEDYMRTAKAKGLSKLQVIMKHQIRNAMIPMVPMMGMEIVGILMGSFVVEQIYSIPGIGAYFVTSIQALDYTMTIGLTVFLSIFVVTANFLVDLLYGLIDPRIRVTN